MIKKTICSILFSISCIHGFSQTSLSPGDIAITGFNCDDAGGFINTQNEFSFVLLKDIESGTVIRFTDNGWLSSGDFRTNEGIIEWETNSNLSCGTEINISTGIVNFFFFTFPFFNASIGSIDSSNFANFDISTSGDQILVYQGTTTSPNFVFAVNFNGSNWRGNAINDATSAIPNGLTNNLNALHLNEIDNAEYDCSQTTGILNTLSGITNATNWLRNNSSRFSPLGNCSYTCNGCSSAIIWDGSWSGTPDLTTEILFEADYNTSFGNVQGCSIKVNEGVILTVNNGSYLEIENDVTIDGNLIVESSGSFIQNGVGASAGTFTGTATLNKTTPVKNEWYHYTYWSSPVTSETIGSVFPTVPNDWSYSFNAANFVDTDGDDIDDDGNDWEIANDADIMTPGVGFAVAGERNSPGSYPGADNISFTGTFNTGDIPVPITYGAANTGMRWNFIGNPYPSAIDFVAFHIANSSVLEGAAYFWSQDSPPDSGNPGNNAENLDLADYAVFTIGTGGTAGGAGVVPNGYVASGQGFFIPALNSLTNPAGNTATFTNAMRVPDNTSNGQFFKAASSKKSSASTINPLENKLWVNLTTENGVFNQILIGYVENATDDYDGMSYDAPKVLNTDFAAALYSTIDNDDTKYVIQGKAINTISEDDVIKLGFISSTISSDTQFKLSVEQFQGAFLTDNPIYLKDNLLNITHNLTDADYTFTSEIGEFNSRFEIIFSSQSLSTEDKIVDSSSLKIIQLDHDNVRFTVSDNLNIESVSIFDLLGRELYNLKGNSSSETYKLSNLQDAIYIAKVELSNGAIITKKAMKK